MYKGITLHPAPVSISQSTWWIDHLLHSTNAKWLDMPAWSVMLFFLIHSSLHYIYSILLFYFHLIMTYWKRSAILCNILSQIFIVKCFTKSLLIILFNWKKDIDENVLKTVTPTHKLWLRKQQLYECFLSTSFEMMWFVPKFYMIILYVLYARHFLLVNFFPKCYFNELWFELQQNVTWTDK